MFIYLNRTGFNGLFRVNGQGRFNVPQGRYVNPRICDEPNLRQVAETLSELRPTIEQATYPSVLAEAREGDFFYFDPPLRTNQPDRALHLLHGQTASAPMTSKRSSGS